MPVCSLPVNRHILWIIDKKLAFLSEFDKIPTNKGVVSTKLCDGVNILEKFLAPSEMTRLICTLYMCGYSLFF